MPGVRDFSDGGGFHIDSDTVFWAATRMVATKDFVYAMVGGVVGDLQVSAGMAGDDSTGHSFASRYEPAARTIVQGGSSAGQAIGVTASKLLAVAVDYLAADDRVAARFTPTIDVSSFASPPPPDCDPLNATVALPMVTVSQQVNEMPVIGKFWPQGDPGRLRDTAGVWLHLAALVDDAQHDAENHARTVTEFCSGAAITAFGEYVRRIWSPCPSGGDVVVDSQPLMENVSAACRQMAKICQGYADAIDRCRHTLIGLGVGAGLITVVGVGLSVFTLGGSDAAAAAGDGVIAGEAAAAAAALATAESELAAAAAIAEAEAVISATLARLAATGALTVAGVAAAGTSAAAAGPALTAMPLAIPATVPPLPPIAPSGKFASYSPTDQAAALAWAGALPTRDPNYGTPEDRAYQVRVAGQPERQVFSADGKPVWADGYRDTDGALVDAKHVRNPGCSPRTLEGLNAGKFATRMVVEDDESEVIRYGGAIANPSNHVRYLEIDTDGADTMGYWQYLAAAHHIPSDIRYIP